MAKWEGHAEDPYEPRMTLCWHTRGCISGGHIRHVKAPRVSPACLRAEPPGGDVRTCLTRFHSRCTELECLGWRPGKLWTERVSQMIVFRHLAQAHSLLV